MNFPHKNWYVKKKSNIEMSTPQKQAMKSSSINGPVFVFNGFIYCR